MCVCARACVTAGTGFAALKPPLTVVKKELPKDASQSARDMQLPSVMTCANYLKVTQVSIVYHIYEKTLEKTPQIFPLIIYHKKQNSFRNTHVTV